MNPQSNQKVALPHKNFLFFPMMQWCNTHLLWHLCWESHFLEGPFPSDKNPYFFFCLVCLSWPGCPWITCWDWLGDRGQIKWVLWLAWTATLERNRCLSLARADVPMAAEPRDWRREDTTALGGSCWCLGMFVGTGVVGWWEGGGEGEGGWGEMGRGLRSTDHLDHGPQRPAWQSQSEQQWTEDSQSADFPSLAFSLAAFQQTHAVQQDFQKELQLGFFHPVKGDFFSSSSSRSAQWKEKVDYKQKKSSNTPRIVRNHYYLEQV